MWGTLKACSPSTISGTVSKLLPSGSRLRLRVKRKIRELGPRCVWWFVVHGSESDLAILEKEWEKVNIQTSWVLEPCFMPKQKSAPALTRDVASSQESSSQSVESTVPNPPNVVAAPGNPTDENTNSPVPNVQAESPVPPLNVTTPTNTSSNHESADNSFLESQIPVL